VNPRERVLAASRGEDVDRIPWSPRLDLWFLARRARGTLPAEYADCDLVDIARSLGCASHMAQGADTTRLADRDLSLRGLGLDNHADYPFRIRVEGLPVRFERDAEDRLTWIETPVGTIHTHLQQDQEMLRRGISLPFVQSYAIESSDDLEALGIVFDHLQLEPNREGFDAFCRHVGEQGLPVARGPVAASPLHLMLHELMPMERFFYLYSDRRDALYALARHIEPLYEAMLDALCDSQAEVVLWGANYDRDITSPRFFEREMMPWLQRAAKRLHAANKLMLCHTDGENNHLLPLYRQCGFDIAESVCPTPMTELSLPDIREGLGPEIAVWGGIPSVVLLDEAMDDAAFDAYLDALFAELGDAHRLVLGVADNVPPDANWSRLLAIGERIRAHGPVVGA